MSDIKPVLTVTGEWFNIRHRVYAQRHTRCHEKCEKEPVSSSGTACWGEGKDSSKYEKETLGKAMRRLQTMGGAGETMQTRWLAVVRVRRDFVEKVAFGMDREGS